MLETYHVKEAALYACKNKAKLEESQTCGCYKCFSIMSVSDIKDWTDEGETAICPDCQTDALLPDVLVPLSEENLRVINKYWFKEKK
jgi:hypothetical protein